MIERFLDYFTPEHYQLSLTIDKSAKTLVGHVRIKGIARQTTAKFHARGLKIHKVSHNHTYASDVLQIHNLTKSQPTAIDISFTAPIQTDAMHGAYLSKYNIELTDLDEVQGKIEERSETYQSVRRASTGSSDAEIRQIQRTIVATQLESYYARELFPCIDEPAAKAVFNLTLTHDATDLALSNTPTLKQQSIGLVIQTSFAPTPKMSTYLLAFAVGEFHKVSSKTKHGTEVSTYAPLNQPRTKLTFANDVAKKSLDFFADKWGFDYPLAKLDQVALPDFEAGAMENWGLITYRESMLLADKNSNIETKKNVAITIAHEVSHQWFGNLVTMQWWDDLWLNESFATMIEYIAINHIFPEWNVMEDFFVDERFAAMNRDSIRGVQPIRQSIDSPEEIATIFDSAIVYAKGACLIYMLASELGDANFHKGLHDYFTNHQYSNTTGNDLWHTLQKYANFDVKSFMEQWLTQPNFPIIYTDGTQKSIANGTNSKWQIPSIKNDLSGYYILSLDGQSLPELSALVGSQKMRLLMDANILTRANNLPAYLIFIVLEKINVHDENIIWLLSFHLLKTLNLFFDNGDNEKPHQDFLRFLNNILSPKLEQIGMTKSDNETAKTTELRMVLLSWLIRASNKKVINFLLQKYTNNFATIDTDLRQFVLTANLRHNASESLLEYYIEQYKTTDDPELKDDLESAICSTKDENLIKNILAILQDFSIIRLQDTVMFFAELMRNQHAKSLTWQFLQENWPWFENNFGNSKGLDYYPRIAANIFKTKTELASYTEFFSRYKNNPELKRAITIGEQEITNRVKLITDNKSAVLQTLEKYVNI